MRRIRFIKKSTKKILILLDNFKIMQYYKIMRERKGLKMKKIEMCKAIAQDMEKRKPTEHISVNQMASFINRNFSLATVKEMFLQIKQ